MCFKQQATRWAGRQAKSGALSVIMLHRQLGTVQKTSHFSEWAQASGQRGGGHHSFSSLSQLIASLQPNKSFGSIFFKQLTPQSHAHHTMKRQSVLKAVKQTRSIKPWCRLQRMLVCNYRYFFTSFRLSFMLLFHMREAVTYSSAPLSVVLFILQLTYRDTHSHTGICFVLFSLDVPTWEQPGALHMNGLSWSEFITLANFSYNYKNRENIHSSDIK